MAHPCGAAGLAGVTVSVALAGDSDRLRALRAAYGAVLGEDVKLIAQEPV